MNATVNNFAAAAASLTSAPAKEAKAPNYTPEQTAMMRADYLANPVEATVIALAEKMGKTARSIVAKLSREKIYVKPAYKTKTGEPSIKKNEHADAIGAVLKLSENDTDSLAKCNKTALKAIWDALANSVPSTPENSAPPMQRGEPVGITDDSEFATE